MYDYRRMPPVEPPWLAVGSGQLDNLLLVGINYDKQSKKHICVIEKYVNE